MSATPDIQPDPATTPEREVLAGFQLLREVGRGAMGVVFQAVAPDGTPAAVKVLVPPPLLPEKERDALRQRFLREARALASVSHPNVVRVLDYGESSAATPAGPLLGAYPGPHLYLAMEFLDGRNLRETLTSDGPFPPERVRVVGLQLLAALDAVHHAGIVHRDVKPENVVVLAGDRIKLTDFGVAWVADEATLTRTGGILGSPAYMAPEQITGRGVDRRSDLFSVAVTLYQLLVDRLPFPGASIMEMAHKVAYAEPVPPTGVPHALARVVMRGLQKSPAARYGNAAEFAEALRSSAGGPIPLGVAATVTAAPNLEATVLEGALPQATTQAAHCPRHPSRTAVAFCKACRKPLCAHCAPDRDRARGRVYCFLHRPVTVFGIPTVRLEVAVAALAFFLLLLCLSPLGYAAFAR